MMKPSESVLRIENDNPDRQKSYGREHDPGVIPLDVGDPDFPTPEHICEAAREAMRQGYTHYILGSGDKDLVEAICDNLKEDYGCRYDPKGIQVTAGGAGGIYMACAGFLSPGDEVIIFDPTYANYAHCAIMTGALPVRIPYARDFSLDRDAVRNAITRKTKAIFLCNPNNPTGKSLAREDIEFLAELVIKHDILLVSDEVYRKLYFDGGIHFSVGSISEAQDHFMLIDSLSKTYAMTGWSVGYVATTPELAKPMNMIRKTGIGKVNVPAQRAALAALRGPQDCVQEMVNEYDRRRKAILKKLVEIQGLNCAVPDSTFYFFGKFEADMKSSEMADYLYKRKVAVNSGTQFGNRGEGWIRLAYSVPYDNVIEGINRIAAAFKELK